MKKIFIDGKETQYSITSEGAVYNKKGQLLKRKGNTTQTLFINGKHGQYNVKELIDSVYNKKPIVEADKLIEYFINTNFEDDKDEMYKKLLHLNNTALSTIDLMTNDLTSEQVEMVIEESKANAWYFFRKLILPLIKSGIDRYNYIIFDYFLLERSVHARLSTLFKDINLGLMLFNNVILKRNSVFLFNKKNYPLDGKRYRIQEFINSLPKWLGELVDMTKIFLHPIDNTNVNNKKISSADTHYFIEDIELFNDYGRILIDLDNRAMRFTSESSINVKRDFPIELESPETILIDDYMVSVGDALTQSHKYQDYNSKIAYNIYSLSATAEDKYGSATNEFLSNSYCRYVEAGNHIIDPDNYTSDLIYKTLGLYSKFNSANIREKCEYHRQHIQDLLFEGKVIEKIKNTAEFEDIIKRYHDHNFYDSQLDKYEISFFDTANFDEKLKESLFISYRQMVIVNPEKAIVPDDYVKLVFGELDMEKILNKDEPDLTARIIANRMLKSIFVNNVYNIEYKLTPVIFTGKSLIKYLYD